MKKYFFVLVALITYQNVQAQSEYKIANTFHIASGGGWDYIAINANKLYVAHSTQVNILDKNTGDSLGAILHTTGVHGIAFDEAVGKGYTSNGKLNNVFVFDIKTGQILDSINVGKSPDAIMYEPFSKKIITCNGHSNDLSIIDPQTNKVVATIPVGGKPETAVSDNEGKLFVNIEDKNEIVMVDVQTMKMRAAWPLDGGLEPTGLAYDNETKRLFAGCDKLLIVVDAIMGKVNDKISIGEGCDGVAFDKVSKTIFTSNGEEGTMTVIQEISADKYHIIENVTTKKSARTITIDEATQTLYLPAAGLSPNTPEGQPPKMIPGSFQVLVIKKNMLHK